MGLESFVWSEEVENSDMLKVEVPQMETPREIQSPEEDNILKEFLVVEEEFLPLLNVVSYYNTIIFLAFFSTYYA